MNSSSSTGHIILLVGGVEDTSKGYSKPKKSSGTEVRIYNLRSLISLARYTNSQSNQYGGIDLSKGKEKGKGKAKADTEWTTTNTLTLRDLSISQPNIPQEELPKALSEDYTILRSGRGSSTQGDTLLVKTYISASRIFVVIGTSSSIVIYGALRSPNENSGGIGEFTSARTFYLPSQPNHISFIQLPSIHDLPISTTQQADLQDDTASLFSYDDRSPINTRSSNESGNTLPRPPPSIREAERSDNNIPSLGLYVSFGSRACLIRVSDSTVLDLKLQSKSSSVGNTIAMGLSGALTKGDWGDILALKLNGGSEIYVVTRGKETFLFSAPFTIPSQSNSPLHTILWPESPCSVSASIDYNSTITEVEGEEVNIRLLSTSTTGNLHVQHLNFSASRIGKMKFKPFGSVSIGNLAKIVKTDNVIYDYQQESQGQQRIDQGQGGCWIRYKKKEGDWRIISLHRE
ncbi:uncharacterized protein L201_001970 [Kwoniella dendrophila CBS 6074]|uniref:CNH domain-containing protein n=1 Tax=Kwoniella dendrophila CBS 6074 TaxID=1295534 RepID=A0AAX4JQS9_9TREE